jgi:putative membrane protein
MLTPSANHPGTPLPFPWWAAGLFACEFTLLAWAPHDRSDWLLENLISIPAALFLVLGRRLHRLSYGTVLALFVFLALHEVGSHYTYSLVPYQAWWSALDGGRNHYDRLVHFGFGLLVLPTPWQMLRRVIRGRAWLRASLSVAVVVACSTFYELIEWGAARAVDPELGIAFVGAQGDIWDAQKDTALALLGSWISVGFLWARERAQRHAPGGAPPPRLES